MDLRYLFLGNTPLPNSLINGSVAFIQDENQLASEINKINPLGILIQAELNWNGNPRSSFAGIPLIRKLRLGLQYKGPIIVVSRAFVKREDFPESIEGFRFLEDSAVKIMPMFDLEVQPFDPKDLPWDSTLTKNSYEFLREHLYDEQHYLKELLIHKTSRILYDSNKTTDVKSNLEKHFRSVENQFPQISANFAEYKKKFWTAYESNGVLIASTFNPLIDELDRKNTNISSIQKIDEKDFHILIVDDSPLVEVIEFLESRKVSVHKAKGASDALEILRNDHNNEITVIVCGTIFRDEHGRYARIQGVDILEEVKQIIHVHSTIVLTGAHKSQLAEVIKVGSQRILPLFKEEVLNSNSTGLETLFKLLIEENLWVLNNLILPKDWKANWKSLYKMHRDAADYYSVEANLSLEAFNWILKVQNSTSKTVENWPTAPFQFRPPKNPGIDFLEKFRTQLFYRRIGLGLLLLRSSRLAQWSKRQVWDVIGNILVSGRIDMPYGNDNMKDVLSKLQLKKTILDPLQQSLAKEEIEWIQKSRALLEG